MHQIALQYTIRTWKRVAMCFTSENEIEAVKSRSLHLPQIRPDRFITRVTHVHTLVEHGSAPGAGPEYKCIQDSDHRHQFLRRLSQQSYCNMKVKTIFHSSKLSSRKNNPNVVRCSPPVCMVGKLISVLKCPLLSMQKMSGHMSFCGMRQSTARAGYSLGDPMQIFFSLHPVRPGKR